MSVTSHHEGVQIDGCQRRRAVAEIAADQTPGGSKGIARRTKTPLRRAEFRCQRIDGLGLDARAERITGDTINIPPSTAVGNEVEVALGRPFRLEDRFGITACHLPLLDDRAIRSA